MHNLGQWYVAIAVTGVGATHQLWINEDGSEAIYVVLGHGPRPSYDSKVRELPAWTFDRSREQFGERRRLNLRLVLYRKTQVRFGLCRIVQHLFHRLVRVFVG